MNPLLDFSGLPRFAEIKPEHVTPAVDELLVRNRALTAKLLADSTPPTWENFVQPFEDANEHLSRAWGQVGHLNMVMNGPELREVYNANLPKVTQYYAELSQNLALYQKYKAIRNSNAYAALNDEQKKVIENELRDFRLGGAELPEDKKARFMAVQEELSELTSKFSDNLLDATNAYTCVIEDEKEISGIPADECQVAAEAAQEAGKKGWLFTLKAPSYGPVMQYADNRALRERMYRAYTTRASEQLVEGAKVELDNTPLMTQILQLRAEQAHMLGFDSYAEYSLASKMADTPHASGRVPARIGATRQTVRGKRSGRIARVRCCSAWTKGFASMGCRLCEREVAPAALRFFRTGSEAILPRGCRAVRVVRPGRNFVRSQHQAIDRPGLARHRAFLRHPRQQG